MLGLPFRGHHTSGDGLGEAAERQMTLRRKGFQWIPGRT